MAGNNPTRKKTESYTVSLTDNGTTIEKREPLKLKRRPDNTWYYMGLFGEIGFTIAVPIAGGAILGRFLDDALDMYPKMTLTLLFLGIAISLVSFVRTIVFIVNKKS